MVSKAQKFRLGIFIAFSSVLLIVFLVVVAGNKLLEKRDVYYIHYEDTSVIGLQVGGQVKYHGISVGRVDDIKIDKEDIKMVVVTISVKEGTPLKEDVLATLAPVGITGLKQIELSGGTNEAKLLEPKSNILPGESVLDSITGKAEIIAEKLEIVLNNIAELTNQENQEKFANIISNVDILIEANRDPITHVITNLDSTTYYLAEFTESANESMKRFNALIQSEEIDNILVNAEKVTSDIAKADLAQLINDLNKAINQANEAFLHIDLTILKSRQDILQTLETLKETVDYLNEFSRQVSENPSILLRTIKQ